MTPRDTIADFIRTWEGGLSLNKSDTGNYVGTTLVGSKFGVTPAALAGHRGVPITKITAPVMAALTSEEAADIGMKAYFTAPRMDLLVWNRVTASIVDMGWGAGPAQAIKLLQRMVKVADDGKLGPMTAAAYKAYVEEHGEVAVACEWANIRCQFYADITEKRPSNAIFLNGWIWRTFYFTPSSSGRNQGWWERFDA